MDLMPIASFGFKINASAAGGLGMPCASSVNMSANKHLPLVFGGGGAGNEWSFYFDGQSSISNCK
jgi:hypothetical protein